MSSFGAHAWRSPTEITAIRRVLDTIEENPDALRPLALAWHEQEQARGLAPATLSQRWAILSALLTAIAKHTHKPAASIGPRPRTSRRSLDGDGVAELIRDLLQRGRPRDAAIVGLLGEVGLTDEQTLALCVRDVAALVTSADLRNALALASVGGRPQDAAIRARRRRSLSIAALYQILAHEGVSVAALRRAALAKRRT